MDPDSPTDGVKKQLAGVDTSPISINLSFDRTLSPSDLKLRLGTFVPDLSVGRQATTHQIPTFSSTSNLHPLPKIQEIHGSSAPLTTILEATVDVEEVPSTSFSGSFLSNSDSMTTADMVIPNRGATRSFAQNSTASMRAAADAMDQELQNAVDVMLQGSVPLAAPGCAYYNEDKMLGHTVMPPPRAMGASIPPLPPSSVYSSSASQNTSSSTTRRRGPYYHAMQSTRQLRHKLSARFARQRFASATTTTTDDYDNSTAQSSPSDLLLADREAAKRKLGASTDETCEKRARTAGGNADAQPRSLLPSTAAAPPSWMPKFLYPVMYYVQLRPLRALGIVLAVLAVFLVLLIVILIVGVFPFLMRSTLHDFSLVVTSLHAIPPPEIAQALSIEDRSLSRVRLMAVRAGRVGKEFDARPDLPSSRVPAGESPASFLLPHVQHVQTVVDVVSPPQSSLLSASLAHSSAVAMAMSPSLHSSVIQTVPHMSSRALVLTSGVSKLPTTAALPVSSHQALSRISSVPKANDDEEDLVTITATSVSIVHIQRELAPAAVATPPPATLVSSGDFKALDTPSTPAATMYMMQLAGNLTSGGPIGVQIEFTEPLRLLWRDTVVGIVHYPESIHVPGRGTTQWKWPPFEVSIPANGTSLASEDRRLAHKQGNAFSKQQAPQTLIHVGADHVIDSGYLGGSIAQRRAAMGSGNAATLGRSNMNTDSPSLAGWFAAIQSHQEFTMHWKSRARLSAMGMHASNIKFEKSVRVVCGQGRSCSVTDRSLSF
ncbi:hypothetical protein GGI20_004739 [Coemansia sp. BCRC 34301]|nr:hypothetical protein GGI20_004739 [Coemansia sp. BCRC 34301]